MSVQTAGQPTTVAVRAVSDPWLKRSLAPTVVPTYNQYSVLPVPSVHWNDTVDAVKVEPGAGVVISAAAVAVVIVAAEYV